MRPTVKTIGASILRRKKIILIVFVVLVASLLTVGAIVYFSTASKLRTILPGNPVDFIAKNEPLKTADDGRTNFLVFGTSQDDPNPTHGGGHLTDSLLVLSVDKASKTAHTISIPRDLWVTYDTPCRLGESGKVNAAYVCALGSTDKDKASVALARKIGDIVGLQIQYYTEVNYTFVHSLTDKLGGIDVDIYSADSRGIYDPTVGLRLPAGTNHLDGKTALKLARARNSNGGYGLPRSNFDREINQQRIVAAIFKKVAVGGTFSNMTNALKLVDALSGQVRTNVQTKELRSAIDTTQSIDAKNVTSISLASQMTTDRLKGQSIVRPVAGLNDYSAVREYVAAQLAAKGAR